MPGKDTAAARGVQRNNNQASHFNPKPGRGLPFALRLSVQPEELHRGSTLILSEGEENYSCLSCLRTKHILHEIFGNGSHRKWEVSLVLEALQHYRASTLP